METHQTVKEFFMKQLFPEDFSGQPPYFLLPRQADRGDMLNHLPYGNVFSASCAELFDGYFIFADTSRKLNVQSRPDTASALPAGSPLHREH